MKYIFIFIIKFYQLAISPMLGRNCRFYPTCSSYAIEALKKFGFFYGSYLLIKRIMKCGPWHSGGYDPVPSKKNKINFRK